MTSAPTSAAPGAGDMRTEEEEMPVVRVKDLWFSYENHHVLRGINLRLEKGQRMLLIGANGAGKSTLLRVLGGRHMFHPDDAALICGRQAFHDTRLNFLRSYLDTQWGMRTVAFAGYGVPMQADIAVVDMMKKMQDSHPERRDELYQLLGINPNWRMHALSDGQRRRVQIMLGLVRPFEVLLMDEVTVSLDVVVRQDLLLWLRQECETRGCCVIYATHIFDGLDDWPTHLHYLTSEGTTGWQGPIGELDIYRELRAAGEPSPMLRIACKWLRDELAERKKQGLHMTEGEAGEAASTIQRKSDQQYSAGGFAPGRMSQGY